MNFSLVMSTNSSGSSHCWWYKTTQTVQEKVHTVESFCIFHILEEACQWISHQCSPEYLLCTFRGVAFCPVSFPTRIQLHLFVLCTVLCLLKHWSFKHWSRVSPTTILWHISSSRQLQAKVESLHWGCNSNHSYIIQAVPRIKSLCTSNPSGLQPCCYWGKDWTQ